VLKSSLRSLKTIAVATAVFLGASAANAITVSIDSYDNGWDKSSGAHYTSNTNIIAGSTYNNWFAFDLSSVFGNITSATLTIFAKNGKYLNSSSSALYQVFDVSTNIDTLTGGRGGLAAYKDLETGKLYGETKIATPGTSSQVMPAVSVGMQNALNDINAARGGRFAVGGSTEVSRYLWGFSNFDTAANLTLTTSLVAVPLPATLSLLGLSVLGLGVAARRRRR